MRRIIVRDILVYYREQIIDYVKSEFNGISDITDIRINMSAVFKCVYNGRTCIFKYSLLKADKMMDRTLSEYLFIHADKMIKLSECIAFPAIYVKRTLEIKNCTFLLTVEEMLPYTFAQGIMKMHSNCGNDDLKCTSRFLKDLLNLYLEGEKYGFISHRDLSFDNLMFDENYNLKMIDLGSAKSTKAETTMFHIAAPTKYFYSAPEYENIHLKNKTEFELIKAEIYTIGLLTLSLLNALKENLFIENSPVCCGIMQWLRENGRQQDFNEKLTEINKRDFINHILINSFFGDDKNVLYRLLKGMTDKSVSARIPDYYFILKNIEKGEYNGEIVY